MQTADNPIQYFLLSAHVLEVSTKAVLTVYGLPDIAPIIGCVGLLVDIHIEVLALVVLDVLHVPDPRRIVCTLRTPLLQIARHIFLDEVSACPFLWDILLVAATDRATPTFAHFLTSPEWTFIVDVDSDDAEELRTNECLQIFMGCSVYCDKLLRPTIGIEQRAVQTEHDG